MDGEDIVGVVVGVLGLCSAVTPIFLGVVVGTLIERSHLKRLARREAALQGILVTQLRSFPALASSHLPPRLICAEVVISSDYLRTLFTNTRKIFGGEMRSMTRVADRARREATLRVLEEAQGLGYNAVCNLRYASADLAGNSGKRALMSPIFVYGTAYIAAGPKVSPAAPTKSPFSS